MAADEDEPVAKSSGFGSASFAAQHSVAPRRSFLVAPTDESSKFNAIRIPLIPVACWRLGAPGFAFDSSFVAPAFREEVATLRSILAANPECPAALFGHCDPAGSDALNKTLGDRRAIAIYALLTRQPDLWTHLHDNSQVGDTWDLRMVQTMLSGVPDGQGNPYLAGGPSGVRDSLTTDAVKRFQSDAGLAVDGDPGPDTRKALYGAYMDWLCTPDESPGTVPQVSVGNPTSTGPLMKVSDFLGGAGAGAGDLPKVSLQSCGKFNPILLLTSDEMGGEDTTDGASKVRRNTDDAPNRRVIMFLFPKGTSIDPSRWPCPKVKELGDACRSAFWPDGDQRRQNGPTQRLYKKTRDTMACRFYDRFARRSPCEGGGPSQIVWIVEVPSWVSGDVKLVVYDSNRNIVVEYAQSDGTVLQPSWLSFDFSKLDKNKAFTVELHSADVCVIPPVQITISALLAQSAGVDGAPAGDAYAFNSLVQAPRGAQ